MRVLMIAACPYPTAGGTQALIGALAGRLAAAGVGVEVVTYGFGAGDWAAHDRRVGFGVRRAWAVPGHRSTAAGPSWGRPVADGAVVWAALEAARGGRFDLIHAHNYEGALAAAAVSALTGLPWLYHAHNLMADELPRYGAGGRWGRALGAAGGWLDRWVPRLADGAVAVNKYTGDMLREVGVRRVWVVPPGLAYGEARGATAEAHRSDVVYAGNLDGYQGVEAVFGAARRLASARRGFRFNLVSADPRAAAAARRLGPWAASVAAGGFEEEKPYLAGGRVAVLGRDVASGFPMKLLNYMGAGRPVVACRSGAQGLGEDEGVVVVEDGDAAGMAAAAGALLDDGERREELGRRAREASGRFGWEEVVAALIGIYAQLAR